MASATDVFARASSGTRPVPTTLTAILASGSSPGTASCSALTGWPTTSKVHFCIYTINTSGAKVAGSQTDWVGVVSGTTITGLALKAGTNTGYSVGAVVEASPIAAYADDLFSGLTAQHSAVDGSHTNITSTSETTGSLTVSSTLSLPNNSITAPNLATNAITLGYASVTANQAISGTAEVDLTGLTTTVTVPAGGRRVEIIVDISTFTNVSGVTANAFNLNIKEGATLLRSVRCGAPAGSDTRLVSTYIRLPSAGSHTYKASFQQDVNLSTTMNASATSEAFILVKLI
jgi:hypothetical protein